MIFAKDCPIGDLTFETQSQLNSFISQYPNCQVIDGNLTLTHSSSDGYSNINDLSPLANISTINGDLILRQLGNISSLSALSNLQTINGNLALLRNANYFNNYNDSENFSIFPDENPNDKNKSKASDSEKKTFKEVDSDKII
jgi:hypothetical protein